MIGPPGRRYWFDGRMAQHLPMAIVRVRRWNWMVVVFPWLGWGVSKLGEGGYWIGVRRPFMPLVVLAPMIGMIATIIVVRTMQLRLRASARRLAGLACTNCAYDLRGSRDGGVCPECGVQFGSLNEVRRAWAAV